MPAAQAFAHSQTSMAVVELYDLLLVHLLHQLDAGIRESNRAAEESSVN